MSLVLRVRPTLIKLRKTSSTTIPASNTYPHPCTTCPPSHPPASPSTPLPLSPRPPNRPPNPAQTADIRTTTLAPKTNTTSATTHTRPSAPKAPTHTATARHASLRTSKRSSRVPGHACPALRSRTIDRFGGRSEREKGSVGSGCSRVLWRLRWLGRRPGRRKTSCCGRLGDILVLWSDFASAWWEVVRMGTREEVEMTYHHRVELHGHSTCGESPSLRRHCWR
jgi:hypothetical protein